MNQDRELLELAAKAAGLNLWTDEYDNLYLPDPMRRWNPLQSDGDALRLAVKTKVLLDMPAHIGKLLIEEGEQPSIEHAVRRAIVRAAAEIQRAKETA